MGRGKKPRTFSVYEPVQVIAIPAITWIGYSPNFRSSAIKTALACNQGQKSPLQRTDSQGVAASMCDARAAIWLANIFGGGCSGRRNTSLFNSNCCTGSGSLCRGITRLSGLAKFPVERLFWLNSGCRHRSEAQRTAALSSGCLGRQPHRSPDAEILGSKIRTGYKNSRHRLGDHAFPIGEGCKPSAHPIGK